MSKEQTAKKPTANKQDRKWSLVTYLPPEEIAKVFADKADKVRAYAYCTHDKDEGKEKHTHVVVWLNTPYFKSTITNWFRGADEKGELANTLAQPCKDITAMYRYLIHEDNPDKYQYDAESRICSDPSCFEEDVQTDDVWIAVDDILSGMPLRDVAKRYGRDFIYHYSHIRTLVNDILEQEGVR